MFIFTQLRYFFWVVLAVIFILAPAAAIAEQRPDLGSAHEYINACRAAISTPERKLARAEVNGFNLQCIIGGLQDTEEDIAFIAEALSGNGPAPDGLVVRSRGGSVERWLELIEGLQPPFDFIVVDTACISSCANYAFPLAEHKIVPKGALVVWHGGPTNNPDYLSVWLDHLIEGATDIEAERKKELAEFSRNAGERTAALYELTGVSLKLLEDTHRAFLPENIDRLRKRAGIKQVKVSGVALTPELLSHCYKMTGLSQMTHPGNDLKTLKIGKKINRSFSVTSKPSILDERGCPLASWSSGQN